jgi:hypothetical protein
MWLDTGEAGGEGDGQGQCMGEAGEEGKRYMMVNCENDGWRGGEGRDSAGGGRGCWIECEGGD